MKVSNETYKKIQKLEKSMKRRESYMRAKAKERGIKDYKGANYTAPYEYKLKDIKEGKMTERQAEKYFDKLKKDYDEKVGLYDFDYGVSKKYSAKAKVAEEIEDIVNKSRADQQSKIEELNKDFIDFANLVSNGEKLTKTLDGSEIMENLKGNILTESGTKLTEAEEIGETLSDISAGIIGKTTVESTISGTLNILQKRTQAQREAAINRLTSGVVDLDKFDYSNQMETYKENIKISLTKEMKEMKREIYDGIATKGTRDLIDEYREQLDYINSVDLEKFAILYNLDLLPVSVKEGYERLPVGVITNRRKTAEAIYKQFIGYREFKNRGKVLVDSKGEIKKAKAKLKKISK